MAADIRDGHRVTEPANADEARIVEALSLSRNCLYTSTSLYIWLRFLRGVRIFFVVAPMVLGSVASAAFLKNTNNDGVRIGIAVFAFVAGLFPAIYRALKLDTALARCARLAAEYKNLQHAFRQCAVITAKQSSGEFEAQFKRLMRRLDAAHKPSYTAPEWCFRRAQKKVKKGDYEPDPVEPVST